MRAFKELLFRTTKQLAQSATSPLTTNVKRVKLPLSVNTPWIEDPTLTLQCR